MQIHQISVQKKLGEGEHAENVHRINHIHTENDSADSSIVQ